MNTLLLLLLILCAAAQFDYEKRGIPALNVDNETVPVRVRRFVHRHSCVGIDGEAADNIGCIEPHAATFEHMITPSAMWCNDKDCTSEFNETFVVHSIRCTPQRCAVLLHCEEALEHIKYACLLTLASIAVLIGSSIYLPFKTLRDAVDSHKNRTKNH